MTGIALAGTIRLHFLLQSTINWRNRADVKKEGFAGLSQEMEILDHFFMGFALAEAKQAQSLNEVPIGAVVVFDKQVIGGGHNQPIRSSDPTAHAEIMAIRRAAKRIGNYRLTNATLYVTIEPCAMCAGAIVNSRIKRLVYGAVEKRAGGVQSVFQICTTSSLNHRVEVTSGVRQEECKQLMQAFFRGKRKGNPPEGEPR